ncbi:MAG: hypothetical protein FWC97_07990 [Treponema sp.]|nr:hypothetical protein [Treponema sp.]
MKFFKQLFFAFLFLFSSISLFSLEITGKEIQVFFKGEHTRSTHFLSSVSAIGAIELENRYGFRSGVEIERSIIDTNINYFINAAYSPFLHLPLSFSASYLYNGLLEYHVHAHSILPFVSWNNPRIGLSLGVNFRFTRFFGESAVYESILSFFGYWNFIYNEILVLGIACGNFSDFHGKNMGAFSYQLNARLKLNNNWQVINHIELMQSGVDGLSATFFGMLFRLGVQYTW